MKHDGVILTIAMTFPSLMTWLYWVALADPNQESHDPRSAVRIAYFLAKVIQFSLPVVWIAWTEHRLPRPEKPTSRGLLLGVGFGLVVTLVGLAVYYFGLRDSSLCRDAAVKIQRKVMDIGLGTPAIYILFAAFLSLGHSLLEEYYWRWFVFGRLHKHWPRAALPVSSLAFMAHHVIVLSAFFPERFWEMALPLSLTIAIGGGFWAWLYQHSQSIYGAWLSHALVDVAINVIGYDLVFRP